MSRHLDNLRRLCKKLQLRYGEDDALVLQVKQELEARELLQTRHQNWPTPYREFVKSSAGALGDPKIGRPTENTMNSP